MGTESHISSTYTNQGLLGDTCKFGMQMHTARCETSQEIWNRAKTSEVNSSKCEQYKLRQGTLLLGVPPVRQHSPLILVNEASAGQETNVEFKRTAEDTIQLVTTTGVQCGTELVT